MELQQLKYVVAVAETGNFTRAADRLHVAQPSLSQQLIKLEKDLGHKLFHRLGRRAVPTEAGIVFLERARKILFEVESATKELSDSPSLERRILVGATPTVAPYILPFLITRCSEKYPNLQINVLEDFRSNLMRGVLDGELDLAVAAVPVKNPRLSVETLLTEPLLLVVAKDHPLAKAAEVTGAELAGENFVMLGTASSLTEQVRAFCGGHQFEPKIGFRCAQVSTVKSFVAMGAGISILPKVTRSPADKDVLVYIELKDGSPVRELAVIRHLQRYQTRGAEQFISVLREAAPELVA